MEDPTTIKLKVPRQDMTELRLFQPNSDSAHSWVQSLPVSNADTVVQMLSQAFDDLNRTRLSPETRYSLMEILLPSLEVVLSNLSKRFLNQPLIMPEEPRKMAELCDRLFTMAITGYTIVAIEAIQQRDTIKETNPARLTCEAIQRALIFTGRKILQTFQLHRPMEPHSWETLHQLYELAEYQWLIDLPVPEPLSGGSTIRATYLQASLLSCCKPNQLRQSDLTALYRGLQQWCELVKLESRETGSELFLVDLDSDQPPQYRALYREQPTAGCRTIDTAVLLEHLIALKEEVVTQGASFDKNTSVPANVLEHLITALGSMSMRNFKRTASNSPLWVCMGLGSTHYQVARQQLFEQMRDGDGQNVQTSSRQPQNNPFMPSLSKGDLWDKANPGEHYTHDVVNEGDHNIDLDAATRARLLPEDKPAMPRNKRHRVFEVQLADTSPNGYCLEWIDDMPGDVRAGDILGLKEDKEQNEWTIAVIRWLSRLRDSKTLVGLELLSPRAIAYGASIHRKGGAKTSPLQVLLLPQIKIVGQPQTLITPRAGFKARQKVTLRNNVETQTIQLLRQISSTGGFEQFEFHYIEELGDILAKGQNSQLGNEYDSLWSNI
jgi:hypothetical protein